MESYFELIYTYIENRYIEKRIKIQNYSPDLYKYEY